MRTLEDLIQELQSVDETHRIEAKRGGRVDRSVMETVCAFANEPGLGGGYILLGVTRDDDDLFGGTYVVGGVADPDTIQSDLASQCASVFNSPIRPRIAVERYDGKAVVVAFVPEAAATEKSSLNDRANARQLDPNGHQPGPNGHQFDPNGHQPGPNGHQPVDEPPEPLRQRISAIGSKPRKPVLRVLIQDLCRWRALSARELALLLGGRDHKKLVRNYLSPMVAEGLLAYTIPAMENHPDQRYTLPAPDAGQAHTQDPA